MSREAEIGAAGRVREAQQFLSDVRGEFRKVTWPTRKEAVGGTVGVLIVVAVITTVLGLVDFALAELVRLVLP